jgi:hypothetical protein
MRRRSTTLVLFGLGAAAALIAAAMSGGRAPDDGKRPDDDERPDEGDDGADCGTRGPIEVDGRTLWPTGERDADGQCIYAEREPFRPPFDLAGDDDEDPTPPPDDDLPIAPPAPIVDAIDPPFTVAGQSLEAVITGEGFRLGDSFVLVGDGVQSALPEVLDGPDRVRVVIPSDLAPGPYAIDVRRGTIVVESGVVFTVEPAEVPVDELEDPYPTPGAFYQVASGDTLLGTGNRSISWRALKSAGYLAAKATGATDAAANAAGSALANNSSARLAMVRLIACSPWNDMVYGSWYTGVANGLDRGEHGRGIVMYQHHADNRARLAAGQAPIRNVDQGAASYYQADPSRQTVPKDPDLRRFPYLWIPALDLAAARAGRVEVNPEPWTGKVPDRDVWYSRSNPPPSVTRLDAESYGFVQGPLGCSTTEIVGQV